jgi:hypothetical protein
MYLVGGCVSDQVCYEGQSACYCSEITNKVNYFTPEDRKWHTDCSDAPIARYRHMS